MDHASAALAGFESLESRRFLSATSALAASVTPAAPVFELSAPLGPPQPAATFNASPNFNSRGGTKVDSIVIHTTEGSYASAVATFKNPANQVSAALHRGHQRRDHADGRLANRAWHATYYNSRSIGIEIVGFAGQARARGTRRTSRQSKNSSRGWRGSTTCRSSTRPATRTTIRTIS
jgi:hypothetical protein